ncbi:DUF6691 family protein [Wenxinia saemankumensis]|uniref:Uncharacterized protein n=1 Tax=Wenxinia saemankumensis TaxID=1447782 RepID=A0A1M6ERX7_9RHOB|nr:DUF6691 family protein [Wenxinia saemankumensis]SHI88129.1 hypothetical protein SAMN05444417_2139 [Wenxinia saemankumensis]
MRLFSAYLIGLVFGLGIVLAGMANPAKVLNFFDIAGTWDPSLALVMVSALTVTGLGYRFVLRRGAPVLGVAFHLPTSRLIDRPLVAGSALFGLGWGIAGFCPGGALPALGTGRPDVILFVAAMIAGMYAARLWRARTVARRYAPA